VSALSSATHARLAAELEQLRTVALPAAEEMVVLARQAGDMAENRDYFIAKEEEGAAIARIAALERLLAQPLAAAVGDSVVAGVVVSLRFGDGSVEAFLFGSIEEQPEDLDVITSTSPLGTAIAGKAVGDTVTAALPAAPLTVTIEAIDPL
jgi:transcription elongation factor GreA